MRFNEFEGASLSRPLALLFLLLLGFLAIPIAAHAAIEGRACAGEPTVDAIAYGELITCDFNPNGDTDVFRFQGVAGEHIFVTATRPSGQVSPCLQLFRESGGLFASSPCTGSGFTFTVSGTLDETGLWTILVVDGGTTQNVGPYNLVLDRLSPTPPTAEPLDYGATITGEINPIGDGDLFILGGTLGSTVAIQTAKLTGSVRPCIYLYDPDGALVASDCHTTPGSSFAITTTLQTAGTHTVYVADRANNELGTFSLTLQCIAGVCPNLHTLAITGGPAGTPNPVRSASTASLDVTAVDSFNHPLTYAWTASCPPALGSNGSFSSASAQNPTWTAPANLTGIEQVCTVQVTVTCDHGLIEEASYEQGVHPVLPPDITVTPLALDFGSVPVGTTSEAKLVTIKNDGTTDDLIINTITLTGTLFQKVSDGCSNTTLPPGGSCTVSVRFKPATMGLKSSMLSIPSNDPDPSENPAKVTLSGTGTSGAGLAPDITVTPLSLDFGGVAVGATSAPAKIVTIKNDGTADLDVKTLTFTLTAFQKVSDGCSNRTLLPGESCTVSVVFKPATMGLKSANLAIPSNDPDPSENPVKVALTGTSGGGGGSVPDITVTPASLALDFGSVAVNATSDKPVTVTNDGAGDLIIKTLTLTGAAFQKASDDCSNRTLPPGDSCTVSVRFKPATIGPKTSTLSIPSNDPDPGENPVKVALSGTSGGGGGPLPDITVTPTSLALDSTPVGGTSPAQLITILNDVPPATGGDLIIGTITLTGTQYDMVDGCSNTMLAPGQSCTVSVVFKPTSTGLKSSTLSIPSNDPDASENPAKVALSGTGTSGGGGGSDPDITVTPAALDFGGTAVGVTSPPQAVTIQNDGTGDLILRAITLTGTQFQKPLALDFCANTTLPPGQSCTVSVVFKPSTAGTKTSKLSIQSNDPNPFENPARVDLIGVGQ